MSNTTTPTCTTCNDTHRMEIGDRTVLCTFCPLPCPKCASGNGKGAFCATARCECPCHAGKKAPDTKPCQWCGKPTPNSNACDPCWEIQRQVENAPPALLIAMVRKLAPTTAATFMGEGFRIARDNVTTAICDCAAGPHVEFDWTAATAEFATASGPSSPLAVYPFR